MSVQWTEDLSTGIAAIDAQHRELYQAISSLHGAMRLGRLEDVPVTMDFLHAYAVDHFATEEGEMAATRYPGLEAHRRCHREFAGELLAIRARMEGEGTSPSMVVELSQWLTDWLRDHVRRIDFEMARHLRAHRVVLGGLVPGRRAAS
jgi:hemerythrin-like metal-binding protein